MFSALTIHYGNTIMYQHQGRQWSQLMSKPGHNATGPGIRMGPIRALLGTRNWYNVGPHERREPPINKVKQIYSHCRGEGTNSCTGHEEGGSHWPRNGFGTTTPHNRKQMPFCNYPKNGKWTRSPDLSSVKKVEIDNDIPLIYREGRWKDTLTRPQKQEHQK